MTFYDLPAVNAALNSLCTVLLVCGYAAIRSGRVRMHAGFMVAALITSAAFLTSYLLYHNFLRTELGVAGVKFTHEGAVRGIYYVILITHVIGAVVNLPMVICTVVPAARRRFDKHKRIARWTLPLWLYVSVTGVIVYLMLYHWFPSDMLEGRA